MARLATLSKGVWEAFERNLSAAGFTAEDVLKLNDNPSAIVRMLACMREQPAFQLIHGVFTPVADVLEAFKARCSAKSIDFTQFTWVGPDVCPFDFTDDPEVVVVLDVRLDTLQNTCEFAWEWTKDGQEASWRYDGLSTDAKKFRLLQGAAPFVPFTLRWRRIKLNTNIGKKPIDVRSSQASPGLALLFVAAQHPLRIRATDYKTRFGFWLAGLECTVPDRDAWRDVPYVYFLRDDRRVEFSAFYCVDGDGHLAVPVFRE